MALYDKIHWWFRSREFPRQFAYWFLSRPLVSDGRLYQRIYRRRIEQRISTMLEFPPVIAIESSAFCNANCLFCTRSSMRRELGTMPFELYSSLIEQIKPYPSTRLYLSGFGEPLIDKKLADKVRLAKDAGIEYVGFFTNGSLLTDTRVDELIDAGLDGIDISIDGATAETYNNIRRGLDFDAVIANLKKLAGKKRNGKPFITVDVVVTPQNEGEKTALRSLMSGVADRIIFRRLESWAGQITLPEDAKTPHSSIISTRRPPCIHLWAQLNVYWDGTVPLCCRDFDAKGPLGNIYKQSIKEIWQGKLLAEYREMHLGGRFNDVPLCGECNYFSIWW